MCSTTFEAPSSGRCSHHQKSRSIHRSSIQQRHTSRWRHVDQISSVGFEIDLNLDESIIENQVMPLLHEEEEEHKNEASSKRMD